MHPWGLEAQGRDRAGPDAKTSALRGTPALALALIRPGSAAALLVGAERLATDAEYQDASIWPILRIWPVMAARSSQEQVRVFEPFTFSGFDTEEPVVAVSIHSGHALHPDVGSNMALREAERSREEDTAIDRLTAVTRARVVVHLSRFEVDLNRPPDRAVYRSPEDAWGLRVWERPLSEGVLSRSLRIHHAFYSQMGRALDGLRAKFGRFVVLDLHSYNHRRNGADAPPTKPQRAPEINVGSQSIQRPTWDSFIERFIAELRRAPGPDAKELDVRANVNFFGGYFPRWVNARFGRFGCGLALEFKKTYMDEWSGAVDSARLDDLRLALRRAVNASIRLLEQPS